MLLERIGQDIKDAMRSKDTLRLDVLRGIKAAWTNELVATKRTPQETLTEAEAERVIARLAKQRKDSIEQFRTGNREDLAAKEEAELAILQTYLPAQMSREEIEKIARAKKDELGVTDKAESGRLMGMIMKDLTGRADGGDVKAVIESLF